jgi:hypothetical protein
MSKTLYHMLHDPIGNCEAMVTEYDEELINRAANNGMIFIAVDEDGNRTVVQPEDVKEPINDDQPFTLVQPLYVDDRMKAVVDVFDALAASVPAAASADVQPVSSKARSAMSFADALEALRALAYGTGEEGGE